MSNQNNDMKSFYLALAELNSETPEIAREYLRESGVNLEQCESTIVNRVRQINARKRARDTALRMTALEAVERRAKEMATSMLADPKFDFLMYAQKNALAVNYRNLQALDDSVRLEILTIYLAQSMSQQNQDINASESDAS